jgi:hypothetical protein
MPKSQVRSKERVRQTIQRAEEETNRLKVALRRLIDGELIPGVQCELNELGRRIGRAPGYLSHVFAGKIAFRVDHVMAAVAALDVKPEDFFQAVYRASRTTNSNGPDGEDRFVSAVRDALTRLGYKKPDEGGETMLGFSD